MVESPDSLIRACPQPSINYTNHNHPFLNTLPPLILLLACILLLNL